MRENCSKQISIGKQLIAAYVNRDHTIKTHKKRKKNRFEEEGSRINKFLWISFDF